MSKNHRGILLILTGATASGKDTIMQNLLKIFPQMRRVITTTSRIKRLGEQDKIDYLFITREDFKKKVKRDEFIEYVEYGGNLYGTERKEIEAILDKDAIWRIDPSRAGDIKNFIKRSFSANLVEQIIKRILVICITTSDDVILQRLQERNLSSEEITKRMRDDEQIWQKYKDKYDYVVENISGKLNQTVEQIVTLIKTTTNSL